MFAEESVHEARQPAAEPPVDDACEREPGRGGAEAEDDRPARPARKRQEEGGDGADERERDQEDPVLTLEDGAGEGCQNSSYSATWNGCLERGQCSAVRPQR